MNVLSNIPQTYKLRLKTYQQTLRDVGETISRPRKVGHGTLMWDTSHHLVYCPIYKVNSCHTVECLDVSMNGFRLFVGTGLCCVQLPNFMIFLTDLIDTNHE